MKVEIPHSRFKCILLKFSLSNDYLDDSPSEEVRCGRLYYRTLHLDERNDALYVGGMDRVIKVDARNVSRTDCERDTMHMEATAVAECVGKGRQPNNLGKLIYVAIEIFGLKP